MIDLTQERDVDTLRQISLLLDRENQRLIARTLQLTAENARLRGLPDPEQLTLAELRAMEQRRAQTLTPATHTTAPICSDELTSEEKASGSLRQMQLGAVDLGEQFGELRSPLKERRLQRLCSFKCEPRLFDSA